MAKRFTRNIKDTTKITDEPLYTNSQNDIISDDTDVAIRHKDEYHYLTDNIKTLSSGDTDRLKITSTGKNSRRITPSENLVLRTEMTDYVDSKIDEIEQVGSIVDLGTFNNQTELITHVVMNQLPTGHYTFIMDTFPFFMMIRQRPTFYNGCFYANDAIFFYFDVSISGEILELKTIDLRDIMTDVEM